jgi:hypothetical protein
MVSLSGGVSIWFPPWIEDSTIKEDQKAQSEAYLRTGYGQTKFAAGTKWDEFLKTMVKHQSAGAGAAPRPGKTS